MTDASLRELERRFRASGNVEDEAAWLRARVQAGEVSEERLKLAAQLEHLASISLVVSFDTPDNVDCSEIVGLIRWSRRIAEFGLPAWVAAVLPLADDDVICWEQTRHRPSASLQAPSVATEAAREWLACPCDTHLLRAVETGRASRTAAQSAESLSMAHGAAMFCGSLVDTPPDPAVLRSSPFAVGAPLEARSRMQRSAVEWLLGYKLANTAFQLPPQRVEEDVAAGRPAGDSIVVRRVVSRLGCEGAEACPRPLAVNVVGDHFDLWLCAEHALDLSGRLAHAAGEDAVGN